MISGFAVLAVYLPVVVLLRDRPRDRGLYPDGAAAPPPATMLTGSRDRLWSLADLLRARRFWLLALAQMFFFGGLISFSLHSIPFFESEGRSAAFGAMVSAAMSALRTPARVFAGWALDRLPSLPLTAIGIALLHVFCLLLLITSATNAALAAFAVLWGIGGAFGSLLFSLTVACVFGAASFATVSGALLAAETTASFTLPLLGGMLFDRQGTYDMAFALYAASFALSALAWWLFSLGPAPRAETRVRRAEA